MLCYDYQESLPVDVAMLYDACWRWDLLGSRIIAVEQKQQNSLVDGTKGLGIQNKMMETY